MNNITEIIFTIAIILIFAAFVCLGSWLSKKEIEIKREKVNAELKLKRDFLAAVQEVAGAISLLSLKLACLYRQNTGAEAVQKGGQNENE